MPGSHVRLNVLKRENDALRQRYADLEELVANLRSAREDIAQMILQRLRTSTDLASVMKSIRRDLVIDRNSNIETSRPAMLSIHSRPQPDSMIQNPPSAAFTNSLQNEKIFKQQPSASSDSSSSALQLYSAPQFMGSVSEIKAITSSSKGKEIAEAAERNNGDVNISSFARDTHSGPSKFPRYIDPRLDALNIAFWTAVPVTDQYAAGAISSYLETEHAVLGLFDTELFIRDLVDCKIDYCSPFLVSSLLAFASVRPIIPFLIESSSHEQQQTYALKEPYAGARSYEFEMEAEKLWSVEEKTGSIPTLTGLVFLWLSVCAHGHGATALRYIEAISGMATKLKLFGAPDSVGVQDFHSLPAEKQRATAYAAWGAFNVLM
ncbi:MAG: hypothetical protein M1820_007552 [Bogoriella megaspora]|nr:MAG: hypothetical protein M1820_007552 [Bogoriella megaspora]